MRTLLVSVLLGTSMSACAVSDPGGPPEFGGYDPLYAHLAIAPDTIVVQAGDSAAIIVTAVAEWGSGISGQYYVNRPGFPTPQTFVYPPIPSGVTFLGLAGLFGDTSTWVSLDTTVTGWPAPGSIRVRRHTDTAFVQVAESAPADTATVLLHGYFWEPASYNQRRDINARFFLSILPSPLTAPDGSGP